MISWPFPKLLGGKNERELSRIRPIDARINEIEAALQRAKRAGAREHHRGQ